MNTVILLLFGALAVNSVRVFSTMGNDDSVLDVIGRQISHIITNKIRGDAGIDAPTLPIEDSIHFEYQHVDLCGSILCISANLTKGTLSGLTGYDILKLDFNSDGTKVTIDIDMTFSQLLLYAEYYEMNGNVMHALPLAGEGKLQFEVTGFRFWTTIELHVTDHTSVENFENSGFNITSISSRTEFDGNIDGIFNAMVGDLLAERLNRFNKVIAANCGDILKELINPILN